MNSRQSGVARGVQTSIESFRTDRLRTLKDSDCVRDASGQDRTSNGFVFASCSSQRFFHDLIERSRLLRESQRWRGQQTCSLAPRM